MAILFADSFDLYGDIDDMMRRWDSKTGISVRYQPTLGRFGGGAASIREDDNGLFKGFTSSTTVIFGASFFILPESIFGSDTLLFFKESGSTQIEFETTAVGGIIVKRGSTTIATTTKQLPINRWTRIEIKMFIDNSVGTVEMRVDGEVYIDFTGDTQSTVNAAIDQVGLYAPLLLSFTPIPDVYWDDVVIMDDTGAINNDFIGDVNIEVLIPDGDSAQIDFTPTGAGTTNADRVDDGLAGPDDDTTYVESLTVGHKDRYTVADLTTSNISSIHAVQNSSCMKKDSAGAVTAGMVVLSNVTESVINTQPLSTSYAYVQGIQETDPDTATAWTESGVNAMEIGQTVVA